MLGLDTLEEKKRKSVLHETHIEIIIRKTSYKCLCLCSGGDVHQPCGGESKDPRGAETLAGGRLGPHHPAETGERNMTSSCVCCRFPSAIVKKSPHLKFMLSCFFFCIWLLTVVSSACEEECRDRLGGLCKL